MNYHLYVFLIWVSYPVRLLMFFYSNDRFYSHLLFGFRYRFVFAWNQVCFETDDMTSNLIARYNNVCGMGFYGGPYQDGSYKITGGPDAGRTVATYNRRYRGWYDYYDLMSNRSRAQAEFFNMEPSGEPTKTMGKWDKNTTDYVARMLSVQKATGFFGGTLSGYIAGMSSKLVQFMGVQKWMFFLTWILELLFIGVLFWLVRKVYRMITGKKKFKPRSVSMKKSKYPYGFLRTD